MKILAFLLFTSLCLHGQVVKVPERQIVPLAVKSRAKDATQKIVDLTIKGDFKAAVAAMNPDYVKIKSRPFGGPEKFKAQLLKAMQNIQKQGVVFDAAITLPPDSAFEVDYGFRNKMKDGKPVFDSKGNPVKEGYYRSWMVFVPTVKDISVLDHTVEPPKLRKIRKWGFEVAISPKDKENWTFINGSTANALELRKLFPYLPKDDKKLNFPAVKHQDIKLAK